MKRILFTILLLSVFIGIASAALTYDELYYMRNLRYIHSGSKVTDPLYLFMNESIGYLEGSSGFTSVYLTPTDTAPTAAEGVIYASDADNGLKYYTGTAWVDVDVSGASSLATAYTAGSKILAPTLAVEIEVADGSDNGALILDSDDTSDAIDVLAITNAGDDAAACSIQIDGTAGYDIQGTSDTWQVGIDGTATFVGLTVTTEDLALENGAEIQNVVDTEVRFIEDNGSANEDFIFDFGTNVITLKSGTDVVELAMGTVDNLSGVDDITFDAAGTTNTITLAGSGAGKDLTIQQTVSGADASLILQSTGSGTDALSLISSVADISLSSADNITRTAADDITDTTTDGGYTLDVNGGTHGDLTVTVEDVTSIVGVDSMTLQTTAAEADISVNSVLGSIIIEAEEDCANAVLITADGDTASTLEIFNDTGTSVTEGAYSIQLLSDAGGIELKSTANLAKAIDIMVDGGTTSSVMIFNDTGASVTEAGCSIEVLSDAGGVELRSTANLAKSIALTSDGGTTGSIWVYNDQGASVTEGAASIQLYSDAGGIGLESNANLAKSIWLIADGGATETVLIESQHGTGASATTETDAAIQLYSQAGGIGLYSKLNGDDAIRIETNGGDDENITIHSHQGTGADSITLETDEGGIALTGSAGGIVLTADGVSAGDITIDAEDTLTIVSADLAANGIYIHENATSGTSGSIKIHADKGTSVTEGASSIQLLSDVGGIGLETNGNLAKSIWLLADGGATETILLETQHGNTAGSIELQSDAGGVTVTALNDLKVAAALCLNDAETFGGTDTTPAVTGASFFLTHASEQTLTDFDGTIDTGHIIYIESTAAVTYDVDGDPGNLKGGGTNLVTADGDVTGWIYNGTDWLLILFMDVSASCAGGMN